MRMYSRFLTLLHSSSFLAFMRQLPLILSGFTLACRFTDQEPTGDPDPNSWDPSKDRVDGQLTVKCQEVELPALSQRTISVEVSGNAEGWVDFVGILYSLGGEGGVMCFQPVELPRRKTKAKKGARGGDGVPSVADTSLRARVVRGMPKLTCKLHPPEAGLAACRQGGLVKLVMEVKNEGQKPAHSLRIAVSHPDAVSIRAPDELDQPVFGGGSGGGESGGRGGGDNSFVVGEASVLPVHEVGIDSIGPGQTVKLPIWTRPPSQQVWRVLGFRV